MNDISSYVHEDGGVYYFDTENYTNENSLKLSLEYESGDRIIWKNDGKKFSGTLREVGTNGTLFVLERVTEIE